MTDHIIEHLFQNDAFLPSQMSQTRPFTPERRLLLAILEEAVSQMRTTRGLDHPRAQRLYAEVAAWFTSSEVHFGSFIFCCHHLDCDPLWLRHKLLQGVSTGPHPAPGGQTVVRRSRVRTDEQAAKLRHEVQQFRARGLQLKQIAAQLSISPALVAYYCRTRQPRIQWARKGGGHGKSSFLLGGTRSR